MTMVALAACGDSDENTSTGNSGAPAAQDSSNQAAQTNTSLESLPDYGLAEGAYEVDISGAVTGGTAYTGTRSRAVDYGPYGRAKNDEGAMDVTMYWDGTYNGEEQDLGVVLMLRDGIRPGTHPIGDSISDGSRFNVRAKLDFDEVGIQDFANNVAGTLTLDIADRQFANGTFEFSAENNAGETVEVSGVFHQIPFAGDPGREKACRITASFAHRKTGAGTRSADRT